MSKYFMTVGRNNCPFRWRNFEHTAAFDGQILSRLTALCLLALVCPHKIQHPGGWQIINRCYIVPCIVWKWSAVRSSLLVFQLAHSFNSFPVSVLLCAGREQATVPARGRAARKTWDLLTSGSIMKKWKWRTWKKLQVLHHPAMAHPSSPARTFHRLHTANQKAR